MKLIEVSQPTPDVIRLFLEPRLRAGNFLSALVDSLGREKATNFHNVNRYLESSLGDANRILEDMGSFQSALERTKGSDKELQAEYDDLRARSQSCLVELHRAKIKINDLKISLCRFIIIYESPSRTPPRPFRTVEEWMDAATLAEMRLARALQPNGDRNLQKLLALFMTFRSIVCSYDGPSMYIRQIENFLASLDAIYEKVQLEMEVAKATRKLVETRQELSTVKINLTSLENQLLEKKNQAEQLSKLMSLQERSPFPTIATLGLLLTMLAAGAGYLALGGRSLQSKRPGAVVAQQACLDIEKQLAKSPRYQSQVLIFRKFGEEVYFRANAMTCEKLHRLDSVQILSLADLMRIDYNAGNQGVASYGDHRVLQVKDVGINKLVIKLSNHIEKDVAYKLKVLERAVAMRALLQAEKAPNDDLLIVDLSMKHLEL